MRVVTERMSIANGSMRLSERLHKLKKSCLHYESSLLQDAYFLNFILYVKSALDVPPNQGAHHSGGIKSRGL